MLKCVWRQYCVRIRDRGMAGLAGLPRFEFSERSLLKRMGWCVIEQDI